MQIGAVCLAQPRALLPGDAPQLLITGLVSWAPFVAVATLAVAFPRGAGVLAGLLTVPLWWTWLAPELREPWMQLAAVVATLPAGWLLGRAGTALVAAAWLVVVGATLPSPFPDLPPSETARPDQPPLVLLTLDTFRADHVGRIGGSRFAALTPHLDALAERGVLFHDGVAPAPVTGPAHVGLLTGAPPADLGVTANGHPLPADASTVAEELRAAGWRTGAFVASGVLDRRVDLHVGFEHYDDRFSPRHSYRDLPPFRALAHQRWWRRDAQRPGDEVIDRALQWLGDGPRGTFLWVHLYDAHTPHDPAVDPRGTLYDLDPGRGDPLWMERWSRWRTEHYGRRGLPGFGMPRNLDRGLHEYAAEVREVDALVGRLLASLPDDARIVVAADHGESLGEHGYVINHGRHLFQATLAVPIWAVGPGLPADTDVEHPVPSWLVGEELRRLAGLPHGRALADHVDTPWPDPIESFTTGQEARPALMLGPAPPSWSWRWHDDKVVLDPERPWHFDLGVDPEERWPDLIEASPEHLERFEALRQGPTLDEQTATWLESLGYTD
jgi:hypothetical protein